ncbi:chymotrypsin-2-like [Anopheles bellator]|uniref:chymotrypsin-2-like n=1 Tax=Anopheles bellator TaxID=139047 RepID=UPI002649B8DA|nr:chymotrypsin-2-like [Anopheles bellator]
MVAKVLFAVALCLSLVAGSHSLPRAVGNESKGNRIVGGYDASAGQFPHQVSLRRPPNFHFCGGSIIGPRWILSATHCTIGMSPANLNVYTGSVSLSSGGVYYPTMRIVNHPLYDAATIENDISLIQTVDPIVFNANTQSIGLGSSYILSATGATISGWGRSNTMDNEVAQVLDTMQWLTVNILTMAQCYEEREGSNNIFDNVMCVSSPAGRGACSGDSGGPLTYDGQVHGIASFVRVPCATAVSDVYERVYSHRSWITSVIM